MSKGNTKAIRNRAWLFFNIGWTVVYLLWRTFRTVPLHDGIVSAVAGISLLVVEIFGMFEAFVHYFNMHKIENHEIPVVPPEEYPDIDVLIATYNEPPELLYKTVNGCVHMEYPDKNKVHIYICDDGNRSEMKELAQKMGVGYLNREDHKGAKAGNLNHAMSVTSSPLIATFDADMIPRREFLMVTAAYFVDQEIKNRELEEKDRIKIGFIQTPQSFYNPDLFQFNLFSESTIPNEQDYFYKDVQVSRNKSNSVIYGGSNTLISREALNDVGGFYTKSITEDFATGMLIQGKGYKCLAINHVLASGLSPTDLKSLINQRVRWGRGCIQTGRKMHLIFNLKLKFKQKINYLASVWYWYASWKRLIYIMSPILFATFGVMVVKCTLMEVLIFWLPMYISSNISLKMMSRNIRTTKWTNLYETIIFPFMLIPTLLETFCISMKKFKVTKKERKQEERNWPYAIPHAILVVLSVIGIVNCISWTFATGRIDYIVILFWLFLNLYNIVMSLFFILGRKTVRNAERQKVSIPCVVKTRFEEMEGVTEDISESGTSIYLNVPCDIEEDEPVTLTLDDGYYHAEVEGRVVSVANRDGKRWRYAFKIVDLKDSRAEYCQLIYDREPSLPTNLDESQSSFEDLKKNVTKRMVNSEFHNRKKARIPVNKTFLADGYNEVMMVNYNYDYVLLEKRLGLGRFLELELEDGLKLELGKYRELGRGGILYRVENEAELYEDFVLHTKIREWIMKLLALEENQVEEKAQYSKKHVVKEDEFSEMECL
ncbi:glycosyltransferase [Lachnospiraceae bacterium 38-14]|jgi:Glycosyltransferases, probably involved in cell wall biogenesis|uniref:glycosyltransferase n=1 Tax=Roseburia sp. 1XD42-69 TaxID=2320088 RepID=UPI000EA268D5|nr:glycosyltransferase [Roseburia sp. 1XD42-69]RKJ68496.1 glycosyltransferase [Roseburia sp. 1XD42-69]